MCAICFAPHKLIMKMRYELKKKNDDDQVVGRTNDDATTKATKPFSMCEK